MDLETSRAHYKWRFFRAGGFDQVAIDTGADMLSLKDLDQKLWAALSCPVNDLEFDSKTLEYLDTDHDGHIRAPEVIEAVTWAGSMLKDPDFLIKGTEGIPLTAINDTSEEGKNLLSSAREILKNLNKEDKDLITVEDTDNEERIFSRTRFNGDGIIPAESADGDVKTVIIDIMECFWSEKDRSGNPGVSLEAEFIFCSRILRLFPHSPYRT